MNEQERIRRFFGDHQDYDLTGYVSHQEQSFEDVFRDIFDEAFNLLVERQKKYGPENVRKLGLYGIFTRIEDKMERLRHAFNGEMKRGEFSVTETDESSDESLDDGDIDAANYHLIRVALRRGLWGKPLREDMK